MHTKTLLLSSVDNDRNSRHVNCFANLYGHFLFHLAAMLRLLKWRVSRYIFAERGKGDNSTRFYELKTMAVTRNLTRYSQCWPHHSRVVQHRSSVLTSVHCSRGMSSHSSSSTRKGISLYTSSHSSTGTISHTGSSYWGYHRSGCGHWE